MKIRDNKTGEVFEYGTNGHHALRISRNGGCLMFENLQNGDGSLESGGGGYSFVLDDGKTPEESDSPDAINYAAYANIGGFHRDNTNDDGWIPVDERMPTKEECENDNNEFLVQTDTGERFSCEYDPLANGFDNPLWRCNVPVVAWMPLPEPYRPERSVGE